MCIQTNIRAHTCMHKHVHSCMYAEVLLRLLSWMRYMRIRVCMHTTCFTQKTHATSTQKTPLMIHIHAQTRNQQVEDNQKPSLLLGDLRSSIPSLLLPLLLSSRIAPLPSPCNTHFFLHKRNRTSLLINWLRIPLHESFLSLFYLFVCFYSNWFLKKKSFIQNKFYFHSTKLLVSSPFRNLVSRWIVTDYIYLF